MSKSFEHLFSDAQKDSDGFTKIKVSFYNGYDSFYACVLAKPVEWTPTEIDEFMKWNDVHRDDAIKEIKRLNLTIWAFKNIPEVEQIIGDVSGCWMCYFNGLEVAWKFYETGVAVCRSVSEEDILKLSQDVPWFIPHNDEEENFGDYDVHAVFPDLK